MEKGGTNKRYVRGGQKPDARGRIVNWDFKNKDTVTASVSKAGHLLVTCCGRGKRKAVTSRASPVHSGKATQCLASTATHGVL